MIRNKIILLVWFCLLYATGFAQFVAPERMAFNSLTKKRWDKARSQLEKALQKDSLNPTANYVFALYFFSKDNPEYQPDSAYYRTLWSLKDYQHSDNRSRERLKRFPLDSVILVRLRARIDSTAFEQAISTNTENAYIDFLSVHTTAIQRERATELRNEVAYFNALRENTYQAFDDYLKKYPASSRSADAKKKYDLLLYETKTKDKLLSSFENFVKQFPSSPYRGQAERQVFELFTISGSVESFENFLRTHPKSPFIRHAQDILYHLLLERRTDPPADSPVWNDSLRIVFDRENNFIVPFYKDGKYGFIDQNNVEVIHPTINTITDHVKCGNISDEVLILDDQVVTKSGLVIYTGKVESVDDLNNGFVVVESPDCSSLVHKSGRLIVDCADEITILSNRLIAAKKEKWMLFSLTGKLIRQENWDDVSSIDNVVVVKRNNKLALIRIDDLVSGKAVPAGAYDKVEPWPGNRLLAKAGDMEGILNVSLTAFIALKKQKFFSPYSHFSQSQSIMASDGNGIYFFDDNGRASVSFKTVVNGRYWTEVATASGWRLYDIKNNKYISPSYDTLIGRDPFVVGLSEDSARIYFPGKTRLDVPVTNTFSFAVGFDSTSCLVMTEGDKKIVFNEKGQKIFTGTFDAISFGGYSFLKVSKTDKNKKERFGILARDGILLLPPEFDAIGSEAEDGTVTLLKDKKFGLYDVRTHRQIKPEYLKNVVRYSDKFLTTHDGKLFGFIGWDSKPVGKFEFEAIDYWNENVAWVKKNFQWMLYDIAAQEIVEDHISEYKIVAYPGKEKGPERERIAVIKQEGYYGVLSSKHGEIIPATLNRIVNVGSYDNPMYFTAKHVEEASIYVVIYYDTAGKLLRRQVYEEEDYAKVVCTEK